MTCGPWKPIYLELYNTRISHIAFSMKLSENLDTVEVSVFAEIEGSATAIKIRDSFGRAEDCGRDFET
jgi:beta-mannosidase